MRPDPNGNTSSSNPEIQRWYAEQRDHPAAPPVPDPVPQMRARSPQRLHQENDLDTSDDSQADAESDSADTRAAKRQREVEPGELEQMKPAKTRRIEAEPEAEANMQLVSRDEVLPTVAIAKPTVYQQLNEAIRTGDLALLKQILSLKQLDLNASNENGTPPLMLAVEKGHLAIVETLLVEGASPHAVADGVYTPLMHAAHCGHGAVVNLLLNASARIEAKEHNNWTALFFAARKGNPAIVESLLSEGAIAHAAALDGLTPLMLAAEYGHPDVVNLLLKADAEIEAKEYNNWSALFFAALKGNPVIVETLLRKGADPHAVADNDQTPLMLAAENGRADVVNLLLKADVEIEAKEQNNWTALFFAVSSGNLAVVEALLRKGADPHAVADNDQTPLMLAAQNGHADVVNLLLKAGVKIEAKEQNNWTALFFAVSSGNSAVVETLLSKGANPHAVVVGGQTALIAAAINGHVDVAQSLLLRGAQVNFCDGQNINATQYAVLAGKLPLIELLLSHGGQTNLTQNPNVPLVGDLIRHRSLLLADVAIEVLTPELQAILQSLGTFSLPPNVDINSVIRLALENAGVCSPIVQQMTQYFGDIPSLWQSLAGVGQLASTAQKSLSIFGAFAQLDAWLKTWPEGFDPYQELTSVTATRFNTLLKKMAAQLSAMGEAHEATTLAAGLDNLLPLCAQYTRIDPQDGFQIDQKGLCRHLTQQLGLYGVLADLVAAAWFNALMEQKTNMLTDFNDPSLLPLFGRQLKLLDAVDGRSLLRAPQQQGLNAGTYADLMYRQLHMLSQYWTQA